MSRTACGMPLSRMLLTHIGPENADSRSQTANCRVCPVSLGALQVTSNVLIFTKLQAGGAWEGAGVTVEDEI